MKFSSKNKTLFTGFAPNLRVKDLLSALSFLFYPWLYGKWVYGDSIYKVENWLSDYFNIKEFMTVDSARSALLVGLKAMNIEKGDEIILQAYTCVVVINAIKHSGATPVYVDVDNSLNINPDELERKITSKTRAVIVQHTFGVPADMDRIIDITERHRIKLIEDCAHSFGVKYKGKKLGTFGYFSIFSFGSDKCVSCVRGGAISTNDDDLSHNIKLLRSGLPQTKTGKILQNLMHYIIFFAGKGLYSLYIGKVILLISKKLNLTGKIIYNEEKHGKAVKFYPAKFSNVLAKLLLFQLEDISFIIEHRNKIAEIYRKKLQNPKIAKPLLKDGSVPLRFNILTDAPDVLMIIAKRQGIILGDWYRGVVAPLDIDMDSINYAIGSCPAAEMIARKSVNLPTNINISELDAERIVNVINKY